VRELYLTLRQCQERSKVDRSQRFAHLLQKLLQLSFRAKRGICFRVAKFSENSRSLFACGSSG
jgi:hypothetical protein